MTWDKTSASQDEEQTDEDKVANFALMALNKEVNNSNESSLSYDELFNAFNDLFDDFKLVSKKYKLLKKEHIYIFSELHVNS